MGRYGSGLQVSTGSLRSSRLPRDNSREGESMLRSFLKRVSRYCSTCRRRFIRSSSVERGRGHEPSISRHFHLSNIAYPLS